MDIIGVVICINRLVRRRANRIVRLESWNLSDGPRILEEVRAREAARIPANAPWTVRYRKGLMIIGASFVGALIVWIFTFVYPNFGTSMHWPSQPLPPSDFQHDIRQTQFWGQYSPYFPAPSDIDPSIPPGCTVTFLQVLSRHGARDPTTYKTQLYNETIAKIQSGARDYGEGYYFLRWFEYALGADQLTPFGVAQMVRQGRDVAKRYGHLMEGEDEEGNEGVFIRASGQQRVIDSAVHWSRGFHTSLDSSLAGHSADESEVEGERDYLEDIVLIPETPGSNNTLDHGRCTAFETGPLKEMGEEARASWASIFAEPITQRLRLNLPGADITTDDTIYLMDLCPFVSVAGPHEESSTGPPALSDFCHLFTPDEWLSYDYYQSLGKYYGYAQGNPLGPTQGVGFTNELVARLTRSPVRDRTSTNATLDGDPRTFPLDRRVYADFSHDNTMVSIYAALGLYDEVPALERGRRMGVGETGGFAASWMVPFAGRMFVEKMRCEPRGEESEGRKDREVEELVRVLVNDRVVVPSGCEADELGRCRLGEFVEGLEFARNGGRWDECFT